MATRSPETLLFTDREGKPAQLQDIIDAGLDGGYEDRIPELVGLLETGTPYEQLLACAMLVSWGHPEGFRTLIRWASDPAHTPWHAAPVTYDRVYGVDDSFAILADALKTSFWNDANAELRQMQIDAARALLGIYNDYFFERSFALALTRDKSVAATLEPEICSAIENCLRALRAKKVGFDLAYQAASLLIPLARLNDEKAAYYADLFITQASDNARALREVALALAEGHGPKTLQVLERLKDSGNPAVAAEAEAAIARRRT